jgi:hypothetical protein
VRLTVFSTRKFKERASTSVDCTTRKVRVEPATWLASLASGSDWAPKNRAWLGTHLSAVLAVRLASSLALRAEQNLVRNDGEDTSVIALGGTFVGLSWLQSSWFHPYVSGYFRTWGNTALGAQAGVDLRIQRFVFVSVGARGEHRGTDGGWQGVVTGTFGVGYDL